MDDRRGAMTAQLDRELAMVIDLDRSGPPEAQWLDALRTVPTIDPCVLVDRRVVVVAPHPDDESLGVGGTVAELGAAGVPAAFICLTDGEAAPTNVAHLARVRRAELDRAVHHLVEDPTVVRYGLPDGRLGDCSRELDERLAHDIRPGDVVFVTLDGDGHPDHDAAGAAACRAATSAGAQLWYFPVWAWHWHDPSASPIARRGRRIQLGDVAMNAKRAAIACHRSQLFGAVPVVPRDHLPRFDRPFEILIPA
ncbi:MAG: hypothetical protein JWM12_1899 [Ilumatobacteraceae bacterium]|nr:hypothetical protein [Ilumatobacteraceae bacterium]